ncbi:MAG: FtsQ-type POTRA domain-containing protein [Nitrospira sp.]
MKRWLRRRRQSATHIGPRKNQWKGTRAGQAAVQERTVRRTYWLTTGKRVFRWSMMAVAAAVIGWAALLGVKSSGPLLQRVLEIKTVTIDGLHNVGRQELMDRLALKPGLPLYQVVSATLKERLESHPWVKEATIARVPFHELRITIVERKPAAIIHAGVDNFLSDEDGHVLMRLGQNDDGTLPMVTGIDQRELMREEPAARQAVKAGIELARLVGHTFDGRLQVNAANPANLVASVRGVQFQFGEEPVSEQWDRFQRVKPSLKTLTFDGQGRGANEVDLRYENRVIVRERG